MAPSPSSLLRLAALTLAAVLPTLTSAAYGNYFISPPPMVGSGNYTQDYAYTEGDIMTMQWQTNWTTLSVVLWQNNNGSPQYLPGGQSINTTQKFTWLVDVEGLYDLRSGNVFFVSVYETGTQKQFESHYFNITAAPNNSTLAAASSGFYATATGNVKSTSRSSTATRTTAALTTPPVPTAFATSQISSDLTTASASTTTSSATASHTSSAAAVNDAPRASFALALGLLAVIGLGV